MSSESDCEGAPSVPPACRPDNSDLHVVSGWEGRYQTQQTPWDLGRAPPCLDDLLASLAPPLLRVLVPGAGSGHDAIAWARAGHRVTAVDIAPSAIALLRGNAKVAGVALEALEADLFALPASLMGAFDAVWEQTCFCAIPPEQREAYVNAVAETLRPGGHYYGLFWQHGHAGGPPWNIRLADVHAVFPARFAIVSEAPVAVSAPGRSDETLVTMRRSL